MHPDRHQPLRIFEIETFGRGGLIHCTYNLSQALFQHLLETWTGRATQQLVSRSATLVSLPTDGAETLHGPEVLVIAHDRLLVLTSQCRNPDVILGNGPPEPSQLIA